MTIEPIQGEPFRFLCHSESGETYWIDLEHKPSGWCTCPHFACFVKPRIETLGWKGIQATCKHTRMAWVAIGPMLVHGIVDKMKQSK